MSTIGNKNVNNCPFLLLTRNNIYNKYNLYLTSYSPEKIYGYSVIIYPFIFRRGGDFF